jgi:molecular chaperone IbpA
MNRNRILIPTNLTVSQLFDRMNSFSLGFEDMLSDILQDARAAASYPPYNIYLENDNWFIQLALAGFNKDDISVTEENGELVITGKVERESLADAIDDPEKCKNSRCFKHRGIAARNFEHRFRLGENVKVAGANMANGMLTVELYREIPEERKPKMIEIK